MPLKPFPDNIDLTRQGVEIPGSARPGWSGVWKSGIWDRSVLYAPDEPKSLFQLFDQSVARHPDRNLFLRREVLPGGTALSPNYGNNLIPTTYATIQSRRNTIGSALLALEREGRLSALEGGASAQVLPAEITHPGIPHFGNSNRNKAGARRGWAVGVWSKNREEWQVVDLACHAFGLVGVSLYETLGPDVAKYITNHCPLSIIFSAANHLADVLKIAKDCPSLRVVVSMDDLPAAELVVLRAWAGSVNVELLLMSELEKWGAQPDIRTEPGPLAGEEEMDFKRILTISYTSGTTGDPKGVVLTNENLTISTISNALGSTGELTVGKEWRFISYLPLSHIYERFLQCVVWYGDGTCCFTTGDPLRLLEDAQIIKPHFMAGVPRVWNRINAAIKSQMNAGGLKGALLTKAVNAKLENWRTKGEVKHAIYDALVFRKIRNLLGGELLYISSGAAPLSGEVHEILKIAFSCDAIQGFGMTESVGTGTKGIPWDTTAIGTCGQIQPVNDLSLMDVPEMGYTSKDSPNPRGELCMRGPNIFVGYLHDEVNTKKTIDQDGWMHTGDVGEIDAYGRLKIIDRIKNVVKLSQGEYVALEKLEGMYALDPIFASLLVHGDSTRSSLVAIGVLDPERAAGLVSSILGRKITPGDLGALEAAVQDKKIKQAVLAALAKTSKKHKMNGFEMVKGVHLTVMPFSEDVLTPTLKVKRNIAAKKYKKEIDAAYAESEHVENEGKTRIQL